MKISPDTHGAEDGFYPREDESLKDSSESSSEPLEGTSERPVGDVTQELAVLPAQKRRLDHLHQCAAVWGRLRGPEGERARARRKGSPPPGALPAPQ